MSFADIRAQRNLRTRKSYVTAPISGSPEVSSHNFAPVVECPVVLPPDGLYQSLPSSLEIRSSTTSGRGVWVKSAHNPGENFSHNNIWDITLILAMLQGSVLISLTPDIIVLSNQYLDSHCSACAGTAPVTGLKRCTKCRTVWYCDNV
jgi:hypothetical protein